MLKGAGKSERGWVIKGSISSHNIRTKKAGGGVRRKVVGPFSNGRYVV